MLKIFLLRHGETTWNAANNKYCGRTDVELTARGLRQAEEVRIQMEGIELAAVYSSPLQRARITAGIASGKEVITDPRLIEVDFGIWEGKTKEEFITENDRLWADWISDPAKFRAGGTGETGAVITARVDDFFTEMYEKHAGETIMVVAHNGINRLYMAHKLGMPLKNYRQLVQHNSSITCFTLDNKKVLTLELLNSKMK